MHGRNVDDAAATGRAQCGQRLAREIGIAEEIDGDNPLPGFALGFGERLVGTNARVVDEHVDPAEAAFRRRDDLCRGFLDPDVGNDIVHLCARDLTADAGAGRLHRAGFVVHEHHAGPFLAEQAPGRSANATRAARDDRHPSVKPSQAIPLCFASWQARKAIICRLAALSHRLLSGPEE